MIEMVQNLQEMINSNSTKNVHFHICMHLNLSLNAGFFLSP